MLPTRARRPLGMTLTELTVYCSLLSLFAVMLFVNLPTRGSATSEDLRAATSKGEAVLERLTLELGNASATSVTNSVSPPGIRFLAAAADGFTPFAYTAAGELAYQGWVGYFLDKGRLVRVWLPLGSASARTAVTTTPTASALLQTGKANVVCDDVNAFSVILAEANLWQIELKLNVDGSIATLVSGAGARNP